MKNSKLILNTKTVSEVDLPSLKVAGRTISVAGAVTGQALVFNGTSFVPGNVASGSVDAYTKTESDGKYATLNSYQTFEAPKRFVEEISLDSNIVVGGWGIFNNRLGIGGLPNKTDGKLQVFGGAIDVNGAFRFTDANGIPNNVMYTGGSETFILRNFGAEPSTLFELRSKAGNPLTANREATLALTRSDDAGNEEFFDLYNNGYHTGTPVSVQHGLRIQKRGTGQYRPFVFDWSDGTNYTPGLTADFTNGFTFQKKINATGGLQEGGIDIANKYLLKNLTAATVLSQATNNFIISSGGTAATGFGNMKFNGADGNFDYLGNRNGNLTYIQTQTQGVTNIGTGSAVFIKAQRNAAQTISASVMAFIGDTEGRVQLGVESGGVTKLFEFRVDGKIYVNNVAYAGGTSDTSDVNATANTLAKRTTDGSLNVVNLYASGQVQSNSDARLKTNIRPYENGLSKVLALKPVVYDRVDIESDAEIGFIAQEVEQVEPQLVKPNQDILTLDYSRMVVLLTQAVQDQQKQIERLSAEVQELKGGTL